MKERHGGSIKGNRLVAAWRLDITTLSKGVVIDLRLGMCKSMSTRP